eukprot:6194196-Pleurochrysis_carterae.AAC.1
MKTYSRQKAQERHGKAQGRSNMGETFSRHRSEQTHARRVEAGAAPLARTFKRWGQSGRPEPKRESRGAS